MDWKLGPPVLVGEKVTWSGQNGSRPQGVVRWIGKLPDLTSGWSVGIELDVALERGSSDGFWEGRKLFDCRPKHGLLVPINEVQKSSTKSSYRLSNIENRLDLKLDDTQLWGPTGSNLKRTSKGKNQEVPLKDRFSVLESKVSQWSLRNRGANGLDWRKKNQDRRPSKVDEGGQSASLRQQHALKPRNQDPKSSLRKKKRKRKTYSTIEFKSSRFPKFEDDVRLDKESIDSYVQFTVNQAFEGPETLRKNMNDVVAGYFKEIKEDDNVEGRFRNTVHECDRQMDGLEGSVSGNQKEKKFFSFLKWFKKPKEEPKNLKESSAASSPTSERKRDSSCESLDTLFSTQTVRSFAYIPPTLYEPSAPPSSFLEIDKSLEESFYDNAPQNPTEETESIYDRKKKRKAPEPPRLARENSLPSTLEHKKNDEDIDGVKTCHRRTVSESFKDKKAGAYCHVQGKRKAPLPPPNSPLYPNLQKINGNNNNNQYSSLYKKKKPAPPPPEVKNGVESQSNTTPNPQKEEQKSPILSERSNDEQKRKSEENSNQINNTNFTKDVSLSPLPSRPWYKRSQRESTGSNVIKKDLLKGFERKKNKDMEDWMLEVGFPRRSLSTDSNHNKFNIFARLDKNEEKKKEEKRKSQISILTNISELDREAAEIVKKEQAEEKKMRAENDAKYYLPGSSQIPPNFYKNGQEVKKTDQNKNLVDNSNLSDSSYDENINKNLEKVEKVAKTPENKRKGSASGNQGDSKAPKTSNNQIGHTEKLAEAIKSNNFYKKDDPLNSTDQKLKDKENRAQTNLLNIENQSNDETKTNLFSPNILADVTNSTNPSNDKTTKPPTNLNHFKIENKEVNYLNEPWVCQKCTLENPGWRVFCEICSSVKPRFLINIDPRNQNKPTDKPTNSPKEITKTEAILPKEAVSPAKNDRKKPEDVPHTKESSPKTVEEDKSNIKGNQEDNLEELRKKRMNFFTSKLESLCDTNDSINEADKLKLKIILKEMKNSLPKKNSREESSPELDTGSAVEEEPPRTKELGNNRQDVEAKPITPAEAKSGAIKKKQPVPQDKEKVVEAYVITKTTVLEDIIIKKGDKPSKVSAGVQTAAPKAEEPNVVRPPPRTKKNVFDVAFETANVKPPEPKPRRKLDKGPSSTGEMFTQDDLEELTNRLTQAEGVADLRANIATMAPNTEMNTVAVNRLLRRLETAINCGDQLLAAGLAKELAQMKINCSVTRHVADSPVAGTSKITIDLYVEDKVSHQGPIPLQVSPAMTLLELKKKIHLELGIPVEVQRWILGKRLATDDSKTLEANGVNSDSCSVFLYLVAPGNREESSKTNVEKDQHSEITKPTSPPTDRKGWYYNQEEDHYSFCEDSEDESRDSSPVSNKPKATSPQTDPTRQPTTAKIAQNENNQTKQTVQSPAVSKKERPSIFDLRTREAESELEKELKLISGYSVKQKVEQLNRTLAENSRPDRISFKPETWKCGACNYVNSPNRVNCLACNAKKTASRTKFDATEMSGVKQQDNRNDLLKKGNNKRETANNDNIHYKALVELQDADLVPNAEPFNCPICMVDYTAGEGVVLKDCLHIFCRPCLINTVQYSEDAEVKCPYLDETYSCTSVLQQREIKALVPKGIFELHLAKSVKEAEHKIGNAFHCKTPDCRGWCIYEDNVNEFRCPVCKFTNCLTCQAIHTGINCKEYQERMKDASDTDADAKKTRKMLEEMVEKGEAMACPKCQVVLMKKWGCDWLRCSMCKTEICWVTRGFRWGPGGKGDTSGGCKCGVNGIKCHPKCNYCH